MDILAVLNKNIELENKLHRLELEIESNYFEIENREKIHSYHESLLQNLLEGIAFYNGLLLDEEKNLDIKYTEYVCELIGFKGAVFYKSREVVLWSDLESR